MFVVVVSLHDPSLFIFAIWASDLASRSKSRLRTVQNITL